MSNVISDTPAELMKTLINQLFTHEEIVNRTHEEINERTIQIKGNQSLSRHHISVCLDACFRSHQSLFFRQ